MALERAAAPSHLPTLDGWRAVAIIAVLCCHAQWPNSALSPYGAMGVSVFFALSGFLITRRLMAERRIDLKGFYRRRAFRILPPMVVYLAAISLLGFGFHLIPLDGSQVVASLLFYRNYLTAPVSQSWYTGHFWSLAVEEHFYLIWPVLLWAVGVRRARWIAPAFALLVAMWRILDLHYDWIGRLNPALRGSVARTDYRLDIILLGCAVALFWDDARVQTLLRRVGGTALALSAAVAAVVCQAWTPPGYLTMVAILMALLPASTVSNPQSWAGRILELPPLAWLGRLSYSLYIWQQLFLPPHPIAAWQQAPWNLVAIFVCAAASYYLVEQPAIAFGKRLRRPIQAAPGNQPARGPVPQPATIPSPKNRLQPGLSATQEPGQTI